MTAIEDARAALNDAAQAKALRVIPSPDRMMAALRALIAEHDRLDAALVSEVEVSDNRGTLIAHLVGQRQGESINDAIARAERLPTTPTDDERECRDCGRTDGGCDRVVQGDAKLPGNSDHGPTVNISGLEVQNDAPTEIALSAEQVMHGEAERAHRSCGQRRRGLSDGVRDLRKDHVLVPRPRALGETAHRSRSRGACPMRVSCVDCSEGKHGACIGEALVELADGTLVEVTCYCADVQHIPVPDFPDAGDALVVVDPVSGGGVYCCAVCGMPTESEPCREHQPNAHAEATGELYVEAAPSPRRESDVPLQVLVDGVWHDVRGVHDAMFEQHRPDPRVEAFVELAARKTFSMQVQMADAAGLRELLERLEREARWSARPWLSHPYRPREIHG